jgi:hypothetical protein
MSPMYWVLTAVLVGPGIESEAHTAADPAAQSQSQSSFATSREARDAVIRVLRESNRARGRDATETTPSVVTVYKQVNLSNQLAPMERRRLQAQLRTRLDELHDVLHRRVVRAAASGSGGVNGQAQELINLIQTTIAPDTWAVNGGRGTIAFYPPLNVLVVRQTAEAHQQLGDTLGQLRR